MTEVVSSVDGWTELAAPSTNHGQSNYISMNGGTVATRRGYMFFNAPFPQEATILGTASLNLYLGGTWAGTAVITASRITEEWGENTLTWTNSPAITATNAATGTVTAGTDGQEVSLNVTSMMSDVSAGGDWYGVRLDVDSTSNRRLYAAENPDQTKRGILEVDWSVLPEAPVNLIPAGTAAVSVQAPTLDWEFDSPDHSAERQQSSSQVQVSATTSFTGALTYNSGTAANVQTNWPLTTAGTSGTAGSLTAGSAYFWRARVWDDQGQISEWSDTAAFQRQTHGTLTMTNPPTGGTVAETTPPVTWTFTGRTQEAYDVTLYEYDGNVAEEIWSLGKTVGTVTSYTLPNDLLRTGGTFNTRLRVWDTVDRQTTVGDPDYVEVSRDTFYSRDGTPDPVASLTATAGTAEDAEGAVHLAWTYDDINVLTTDAESNLIFFAPLDYRGAVDIGPSAFTLTAQGGVTAGTAEGVTSDRFSTMFDGSNDRYTTNFTTAFVNGQTRTFEGWANRAGSATADAIFGGDVATVQPRLSLAANSNNVAFQPDASGPTATWTNAWLGNNVWVHWMLVFREAVDEAWLLINGVNKGTVAVVTPYAASPGNFQIAARGAASDPFEGRQAYVAVYSADKSSVAAAHYTAGSANFSPDYFSHRVDGVEVNDRIDPADVRTTNASYELDYWGATPGTAATHEIEAVRSS